MIIVLCFQIFFFMLFHCSFSDDSVFVYRKIGNMGILKYISSHCLRVYCFLQIWSKMLQSKHYSLYSVESKLQWWGNNTVSIQSTKKLETVYSQWSIFFPFFDGEAMRENWWRVGKTVNAEQTTCYSNAWCELGPYAARVYLVSPFSTTHASISELLSVPLCCFQHKNYGRNIGSTANTGR